MLLESELVRISRSSSITHPVKAVFMQALVTLAIVFAIVSVALPFMYAIGGVFVLTGKHVDIGKSLMNESALAVFLSYFGFSMLGAIRLFLSKNWRNGILLSILLGGFFALQLILSVTIPSTSAENACAFGFITLLLPWITTLPMKSTKDSNSKIEDEKDYESELDISDLFPEKNSN